MDNIFIKFSDETHMEATAEGLEGQAAVGETYGMKLQRTKALQGEIEGNIIFQSEEDTVLMGPTAF